MPSEWGSSCFYFRRKAQYLSMHKRENIISMEAIFTLLPPKVGTTTSRYINNMPKTGIYIIFITTMEGTL